MANNKYISIKYRGFSIENQINQGAKGILSVTGFSSLKKILSKIKFSDKDTMNIGGNTIEYVPKIYKYIQYNIYNDAYVGTIARATIGIIASFVLEDKVTININDDVEEYVAQFKKIIGYMAKQQKMFKYTKETNIYVTTENKVKKEVKKEEVRGDAYE